VGGAGQNGRKLRSIIAVLGSMAAKADIAAGRAFPVRWLVLFFLRFAERVVQVYVASALQIEPGDLENELAPVAGPGDASPADAVLLAWRLRWYATVLTALLDRLGGIDCRLTGRDHAPDRAACSDGTPACRGGARLAMAGGDRAGFPLPRFNDTS
jgi:hypothetical protein